MLRFLLNKEKKIIFFQRHSEVSFSMKFCLFFFFFCTMHGVLTAEKCNIHSTNNKKALIKFETKMNCEIF